jgi:hypothetical protein
MGKLYLLKLPGIGEWVKKEKGRMVDFKYGTFDNIIELL